MPVRAGDGHLTLTGSTGPVFYHAVAPVRPDEGVADRFDFGSDVILSEPASTGQGYALVEAYDARRGVTGLHVLDEARLSDGPVASAWLDRPVYPGIHGCWVPHA